MNKLVKTIDGSYFTPTELTTYENLGNGLYKVVFVTEAGAGFCKNITEEQMNKILNESE